MKAGAVTPGLKDTARVVEIAKPQARRGEVLVKVLEVGIDGTDMEMAQGRYGEAATGEDFLVLGHEALGQALGDGSGGLRQGDLVVPTVRRPGGCVNCRSGQYDMCLDGDYRECGIKGAHGFLREYLAAEPRFLVRVPESLRHVAVLTEPTSIATKGVMQALEFHRRSASPVRRALVLGAGSLGLLATALLRLHGLTTYALARQPRSSLKGELVEALGATYLDIQTSSIADLPRELGNLDLIIEATGNSTIAFQAMDAVGVSGVLCLMGVSAGEKRLEVCADCINMAMVLGNKVVFGTVSSNRGHFERAAAALAEIEQRWPHWLERLITSRLTLGQLGEALEPTRDRIKMVIEMP